MYVNQFSLAVFAWFSRRRLPPVSDHLSFSTGGRLRESWLYIDQRVEWKNYKARIHKTTLASAFPDSNVSSTFSLLFRVMFFSFNSIVFSLSIFQELRHVTFEVVARKSNAGSHHPPIVDSNGELKQSDELALSFNDGLKRLGVRGTSPKYSQGLGHNRFLRNCPPTPPLSQLFAPSDKKVLMLS